MTAWTTGLLEIVFPLVLVLCAVSLVHHGPRAERRLVVAEGNHVLMAATMAAMIFPATARVIPAPVGAAVFGVAAAGWVGWSLVLLVRGELPPPTRLGDCAANPVHLALTNLAMVAMYGLTLAAGVPTPGPQVTMPGMAMPATSSSVPDTPEVLLVGCLALTFYLFAAAGSALAEVLLPTLAETPAAPAVLVGAAGARSPGTVRPDRRDEVALSARGRQGRQALMNAGMALMLLVML